MDQVLKLKSKTMIELYNGYDELSKEDLEILDLSSISIDELDENELQLLKEDVLNILNFMKKELKEIILPSNSEKIIQDILKESYTKNISYENIDKHLAKETDVPLDILMKIDIFKEKIDAGDIITEQDIFEYTKLSHKIDTKEFSIEEVEAFKKYFSSTFKPYILLRNEDDLKRVNGLNDIGKKIFMTDNLGQLDIKQLRDEYKIDMIKANISGVVTEIHDIDTSIKLKRALEKLVSGIDINAPEAERFYKVYERIAHKMDYDHEDFLYSSTDGVEGRKNENANNMIGGLLENLTVCDGYSRILQQALKLLNIESKYIHGKPIDGNDKINHAWNIVKIDGTWYNTDITWDNKAIKEGATPNYCLQSNEEFQHDYEILNIDDMLPIDTSYDQDMVSNYFSNKRLIIHNEKKEQYTADEILSIIDEIVNSGEYKSDGININIESWALGDFVTISNIVDGYQIDSHHDNGIFIKDKNELVSLINKFRGQGILTGKVFENGETKLYNGSNISITLEDEIREALKEQEFDIDKEVYPIYELTADTLMKKIQDISKENPKNDSEIIIDSRLKDTYEIDLSFDDKAFEMSEDELIEFLNMYAIEYPITEENNNGKRFFELISQNGANIRIDRDVRNSLIETDFDFNNVFVSENEKIKKMEERIEENYIQNGIKETAIAEYKNNFFRNIIENIKKSFRKIIERLSTKKESSQQIEGITVDKKEPEKLPSWDLRNWTKEELQNVAQSPSQVMQQNDKEKLYVDQEER